jgi:hypothetical protein
MEAGKWFEVNESGFWTPQKIEDEMIGEVTAIVSGNFGLQLQITDADGNKLLTPSHKALQSRLTNIKVGDYIRIIYKGTELPKVKGQNGLMKYTVFIQKPTSGIDFVDI